MNAEKKLGGFQSDPHLEDLRLVPAAAQRYAEKVLKPATSTPIQGDEENHSMRSDQCLKVLRDRLQRLVLMLESGIDTPSCDPYLLTHERVREIQQYMEAVKTGLIGEEPGSISIGIYNRALGIIAKVLQCEEWMVSVA